MTQRSSSPAVSGPGREIARERVGPQSDAAVRNTLTRCGHDVGQFEIGRLFHVVAIGADDHPLEPCSNQGLQLRINFLTDDCRFRSAVMRRSAASSFVTLIGFTGTTMAFARNAHSTQR